ncbi:M24 family metallopeptidase [Desulfotalea psychrophila]|uniref:Similar to cobalt-dependent proline dipeptidase n=1 Tax=Desulfotalea psychrophila (strain LSv54 / DSM 12343) TaxID=177439 RepID=Q6AKI1_DESPS|nr:M24 family metallopeptidase [Desulfotalea psychrophila]CAG37144.1 similar to cobalt-dependent proline dipeptidase [Desulfotalea psychrophila LSv54]
MDIQMQRTSHTTPGPELANRLQRFQKNLQEMLPQTEGMLVFSRLNIFYYTGSFINGVLWLPVEGEPILFCKRGLERARQESPLKQILAINSYGDIATTLRDLGICLAPEIAAEKNALSWNLALSLKKHFSGHSFVTGDMILMLTRSIKSGWELAILKETGARHNDCLTNLLPPLLQSGLSEFEIGRIASDIFFSRGHQGILRMEKFGEEIFFGHIAAGNSANYPSVYNGPVGLTGIHPATPFMGSADIHWQKGSPLTIDNGFCLNGYQTDKTQVYWSGERKSIPESVQRAHDFCIHIQELIRDNLRPGIIPQELWQKCMTEVKKSPWQEGFMALGSNKVSFIGHGIGLAIDEYPVIAKGFARPFEEGMLMAVEPKIGIAEVGMVGVENTFMVGPAGGRSITGTDNDIICIEK